MVLEPLPLLNYVVVMSFEAEIVEAAGLSKRVVKFSVGIRHQFRLNYSLIHSKNQNYCVCRIDDYYYKSMNAEASFASLQIWRKQNNFFSLCRPLSRGKYLHWSSQGISQHSQLI